MRGCLESNFTLKNNFNYNKIEKALNENKYNVIARENDKDSSVITFEKRVENRIVYFDYIDMKDYSFCVISTNDTIDSVFKGKEVEVRRVLENSNSNINSFVYNSYLIDGKKEYNIINSVNVAKSTNYKFLKIDDKYEYKDADFYDFINERQIIADRDILISESNKLIKAVD